MELNTSKADSIGIRAHFYNFQFDILKIYSDSINSFEATKVNYDYRTYKSDSKEKIEDRESISYLHAISKQYNELNNKRRQEIINNITNYLYENGGYVEAWPDPNYNTFSYYECAGKNIYDTFGYFENDFSCNFETMELERTGAEPQLPEYNIDYKILDLKDKFYSDYYAQLKNEKDSLSKIQKQKRKITSDISNINEKMDSAKQQKRTNISALSWTIRMIIFLALALSFFVPLFIAATGKFEEPYGNATEVISNLQDSESIPLNILGFIGFIFQCIPSLFVAICNGLRAAQINSTPIIVVLTLILGGAYLIVFAYLSYFLKLFRSGKDRKQALKDISINKKELVELNKKLKKSNQEINELEGNIKHIETNVKKDFDKRFKEYTKSEEYCAVYNEYQEKVQLSREFTERWHACYASQNNEA